MKEIVIISGKGGTGKTSLVASFAALAQNLVLADCDVDAADLHLVLEPEIYWREKFSGGSRARILSGHCTACGKCEELCRFDAIFLMAPAMGTRKKHSVSIRLPVKDAEYVPGFAPVKPSNTLPLSMGSGINRSRALAQWFMPAWALPKKIRGNL